MYKNLPEICYAELGTTGETILIKRGVDGYFPCKEQEINVDELNAGIGVTKAQASAMQVGSMFGWDVPGANPDNYNENGKFKPENLPKKEVGRIQKATVRCNNCMFEGIEDDLTILKEDMEFYKGCPNCKTDAYLMDL